MCSGVASPPNVHKCTMLQCLLISCITIHLSDHITLFPTPCPLTVHCMSLCAAHKLQRGMIHTVLYKGEPMHKLTMHCCQYLNSPYHTRVCRWNCVSHCIGSATVHTVCRERETTAYIKYTIRSTLHVEELQTTFHVS